VATDDLINRGRDRGDEEGPRKALQYTPVHFVEETRKASHLSQKGMTKKTHESRLGSGHLLDQIGIS
jgi:hypothetical protein